MTNFKNIKTWGAADQWLDSQYAILCDFPLDKIDGKKYRDIEYNIKIAKQHFSNYQIYWTDTEDFYA